jgi:hypothetical protein
MGDLRPAQCATRAPSHKPLTASVTPHHATAESSPLHCLRPATSAPGLTGPFRSISSTATVQVPGTCRPDASPDRPHGQEFAHQPIRIRQALIAIGGKAKRIRDAGIRVEISKSFMEVRGQPLLYWNLLSLHTGGIGDIVLCGDDPIQLKYAESVLESLKVLKVEFSSVVLFRDPGLGVHGLPYQARRHLDELFFFDCGHSIMEPAHYGLLNDAVALDDGVAFTAFDPHRSNPRQPVALLGSDIYLLEQSNKRSFALAHPMLVNQKYVSKLPQLGFNIDKILRHYGVINSKLKYVQSSMPPEFDTPEELRYCMEFYKASLPGLFGAGQNTGLDLLLRRMTGPGLPSRSAKAARVLRWLRRQPHAAPVGSR